MSAGAVKCWLVAYDICDPRRLRRVHRYLKAEGATVQYSAFSVSADDRRLQRIMQDIRALIDERVDDVRAYHVPARSRVWMLGQQGLLDGIIVGPDDAVRLLGGVLAGTEAVDAWED